MESCVDGIGHIKLKENGDKMCADPVWHDQDPHKAKGQVSEAVHGGIDPWVKEYPVDVDTESDQQVRIGKVHEA